MPIAKITGHGLLAIALAVAVLWACFVGEQLILKRSHARRAQVMRDLRQMQLQRRTVPASSPVPDSPGRSSTTVG
ncbi:MAG TPA: hypothetical protein VNV86_06975 [Candidatus Acidoferrum sp.]|jgi:hypothetical protein|nr:hypothetical protein [Candidatus Acidoferrum sp.]